MLCKHLGTLVVRELGRAHQICVAATVSSQHCLNMNYSAQKHVLAFPQGITASGCNAYSFRVVLICILSTGLTMLMFRFQGSRFSTNACNDDTGVSSILQSLSNRCKPQLDKLLTVVATP